MVVYDRIAAQLSVIREEIKNLIRYTLDDIYDPKNLSKIVDLENILMDQIGEINEVIHE